MTHATMPSEVVKPTQIDTLPQQGSTMPGDGSEVHTSEVRRDDPSVNVVEIPAENVPWKEKVVGHAKNVRGTLLNDQELKQEGQRILSGETSAKEGALLQADETSSRKP